MKRSATMAALAFVLAASPIHAASLAGLPKATLVVVSKSDRMLYAYSSSGELLLEAGVGIGDNAIGDKVRRGDRKTPEGSYLLDARKPESSFYKAIHVSYPTAKQAAAARARGIDPGGDILIHGPKKSGGGLAELDDSTDGCIQASAEDMGVLWSIVEIGARIEIMP